MATKLMNSVLLIASFLIATASVSDCQVQVTGSALTCSNPSPLRNRPILSGANVTLSCDGGLTAINSTTTDANGGFTIAVNNAVSIPRIFPPDCRVFVTLPANCTIIRLINIRITTLRSLSINRVLNQLGVFSATVFVAAN